ncbi:unnamed protein product [Dibothriocephalus latus]|uniref:Uncharacterized protein n=1 Tax=Dibothriocephalus latus TaxID=60516 RepID=A0A3P7P3D7_DIBLA|nr:unnamed protein product [Dibothriocephalus latus]
MAATKLRVLPTRSQPETTLRTFSWRRRATVGVPRRRTLRRYPSSSTPWRWTMERMQQMGSRRKFITFPQSLKSGFRL